MELKEAIRVLNWSQQQMRLGNLPDYSQNVNQAIGVALQALENIAYKTRLAEGDLETLEKHSVNHWNDSIEYTREAVAVKNLRNRINDMQELLKGE